MMMNRHKFWLTTYHFTGKISVVKYLRLKEIRKELENLNLPDEKITAMFGKKMDIKKLAEKDTCITSSYPLSYHVSISDQELYKLLRKEYCRVILVEKLTKNLEFKQKIKKEMAFFIWCLSCINMSPGLYLEITKNLI
jgi:hypothetical protein